MKKLLLSFIMLVFTGSIALAQSQFGFVEKYGFGTYNGNYPKANISSLIEFKNNLYAAPGGDTGQVYRSATGDPGTFVKVYDGGNYGTVKLLTKTADGPTGGYLFAAVESEFGDYAKIIRSSDGLFWEDYFYCSNSDERINTITMFKGTGSVDSLYFAVTNYWASYTYIYRGAIDANDPTNSVPSFSQLADFNAQFGYTGVCEAMAYGDSLFFSCAESPRIFKTRNGSLFEENVPFNTAAGAGNNYNFPALAPFNGEMYFGSDNGSGAEIWKSPDGINFNLVRTISPDTADLIYKMFPSGGKLWLLMRDYNYNLQVYSMSASGVLTMENNNEFGYPDIDPGYGVAITEYSNHLYIGASVYYWGGGKRQIAGADNNSLNYVLPDAGAQIWRTCLNGPLPSVAIPGDGDTAVCTGTSVNLVANSGMSSYIWNTLATTQSISPSLEGYYVVTAYDANGCANSDDFVFNNLVIPQAQVYDSLSGSVLNEITVCEGDTSATMFMSSGADAYALYIPGQNTGMIMPTSNAFSSRQITIEMWFKPDGSNGGILNEVDPTNTWANNHHDILEFWSGNFYVELPGINEFNAGSIPANQWSHIALRYDGTTINAFINGVNTGGSNSGVWELPPTGFDAFEIGQNVASGGYGTTDNATGYMKDIRIWNSARTDQDILDNMNGLPAGSYADLIYYYKMDEGTGSVANDASGNGNNATIGGYFVTPDVITVSPAAGVIDLGNNYFAFNPLQTTTYAVTYNSSTGCAVDTNFFVVNVPKISFDGSTPAVCGGNDAYLYIAPAGSYTWTPSVTQYTTNIYIPSPQPTVATWYVANGFSSIGGCSMVDSILVNAGPSFASLNGNPPPVNACENSDVILDAEATGGTAPFTYFWTTSGGTDTTYTDSLVYHIGSLSDMAYVTAVDAIGCGFFSSFNINAVPSTDLHGHVSLPPSMSNVDNGFVYVFKHQPGSAGFDTVGYASLDANGDYLFAPLNAGNYMIKVLADETDFPLGVPTYYGNVFQWDSSVVYTHGCAQVDTANITLVVMDGSTGLASISGYIIEGPGYGTGRINGNIGQPNLPFVPGGPLKGIDVKLGKNPGGGIQARTTSDTTGFYMFDSIPDGGYKIYVDIPNLPMDSTRELIIAAGDSSIQNNYFADSASIYINPDTITFVGIYSSAKKWENNFTIYPNPAKGTMYVSYTLDKSDRVAIEIRNAMGQLIKAEPYRKYPEGKNIFIFNTDQLSLQGGVYFISILTDNKKYTQRLVVID